MKGRARQLHSKFFAFHSPTLQQKQSLDEALQSEIRLLEHLSRRQSMPPQEKSSPIIIPTSCTDDKEIEALQHDVYRTEFASVSSDNAKACLYRYIESIPYDSSVPPTRSTLEARLPYFDYNNKQLILPPHISNPALRVVRLPVAYYDMSKRRMEKALCLMSCVRLHKLGLLDDRLLPLSKESVRDILRLVPDNVQKVTDTFASLACDRNVAGERSTAYVYPIQQNSIVLQHFRQQLSTQNMGLAIVTFTPIQDVSSSIAFSLQHPDFGDVSIALGHMQAVECSPRDLNILRDFFRAVYAARWKTTYGSYQRRDRTMFAEIDALADYSVGCVDSNGKLLFKYMQAIVAESQRTKEQRIDAVLRSSTEVQFPVPRIWKPLYDCPGRFLVFGPADEMASAPFPHRHSGNNSYIRTYEEYYRVKKHANIDSSSPLYFAQHLWRFPRNPLMQASQPDTQPGNDGDDDATPHTSMYCRGLRKAKVPRCQFEEMPGIADARILLLSTFLPQVLYQFERLATASSFRAYCQAYLPALDDTLTASSNDEVLAILTAKSCSESESYDKLEWLGDAVLKLVHTDSIVKSDALAGMVQCLHEGHLDVIRSALGENKRFEAICKALGIDKFVMTTPLSRGIWVPTPLHLVVSCKNTKTAQAHETKGKVYADVVEAVLGLVFLKGGIVEAMKVAEEMYLTIPWSEDSAAEHTSSDALHVTALTSDIERLTGYRFDCCHILARQALTHSSCPDPAIPSYEKLEWIGDVSAFLAGTVGARAFAQGLIASLS